MRTFLLALLLLGNLVSALLAENRQPTIQVMNAHASYQFGKEIAFQAEIHSDAPTLEAFLCLQAEGENTRTAKMNVNPQGIASYEIDLQQHPVRPFSRVYYWIRVSRVDGSEYTSPSYWFDYEDNRFTWRTIEDSIFSIHWYNGDAAFGHMIQNITVEGLASIQKTLPLSPTPPLDVYVYASSSDLESALQLGGQLTVAGNASPDLGVVMVSSETGPGQKIALERRIPHEIDHVLLYQATGARYAELPRWLIEGLASLAELYPSPDYQRTLDTARLANTLLPMDTLCGSFPIDSSSEFLAYAEAASFTRFLREQYGNSGMQALIDQYLDGVGCSQGMQAAFHQTLSQSEARWHAETLGIRPAGQAVNNLLPYLIVFGVLILPSCAVLIRSKSRQKKDQS